MVQLDPSLSPRQRGSPLEGRWIVVLVSQGERFVPRWRDKRREREPDGGARRKSYQAPQADDRVEHRAHRIGEWLAVDDRHRRPDPAPTAEEADAVGLILQVAQGLPFYNDHVRRPDLRLSA